MVADNFWKNSYTSGDWICNQYGGLLEICECAHNIGSMVKFLFSLT